MPTSERDSSLRAEQRQRALQRWDTEGGAGPGRLPAPASIRTAAGPHGAALTPLVPQRTDALRAVDQAPAESNCRQTT